MYIYIYMCIYRYVHRLINSCIHPLIHSFMYLFINHSRVVMPWTTRPPKISETSFKYPERYRLRKKAAYLDHKYVVITIVAF